MQDADITEESETKRRGTPTERRGTEGGRRGTATQAPSLPLPIRRITLDTPLPAYATAGASGLDLYAATGALILAGRVGRIPVGIALELPEGYEGQVRPRSGMSMQGLVAVLGTIDSDYRGEICVMLHNTRRNSVIVSAGDRIAQLVIAPVARVELVETHTLTATKRGERGFGSTGVR